MWTPSASRDTDIFFTQAGDTIASIQSMTNAHASGILNETSGVPISTGTSLVSGTRLRILGIRYIVAIAEDTLSSIARQAAISIGDLAHANRLPALTPGTHHFPRNAFADSNSYPAAMNLRDVLRGSFKAWNGLPYSVTLFSIKQELLLASPISPSEEKIRKYNRAWMTATKITDPPIEVEVWEIYDKKSVFLIEYDCMLESDVEWKLEELGKPDMVISDKRFFPHSIVKEHVYSIRGLCLSIANLFSGGRKIIHVQLFHTILPETHITEIGSGPDFHPFPL